jgi:hypothetical protein
LGKAKIRSVASALGVAASKRRRSSAKTDMGGHKVLRAQNGGLLG